VIALLDPALFVWGAAGGELTRADEILFASLIARAIQACREARADITAIAGYWDRLWKDFVHPLQKRLRTPDARAAVDELRKLGGKITEFSEAPTETRIWGFRTLFGRTTVMPAAWENRMADAASRAIIAGKTVMMLVRMLENRNLLTHAGKQNVVIQEVTRWRLYVRPPGWAAHVPVDCVRSVAQVRRKWTIRYDERLPTMYDGARYPFCLPPDWHRGRTQAVRTRASVPAWIGAAGRAWTRPNIPQGAGYHWDVFLDDVQEVSDIGVDQLNIVEYGTPASEGRAGEVHHIPMDKKARVTDTGWRCP
jgi:hypothetical protein